MAEKYFKIKLTPYRKGLGDIMLRQTKERSGFSLDGRYRFYINEEIEDPDFWVVQGKGLRQPETCKVAPRNTILLSTEPRSVLVYPQKYIRQFGTVCTCQPETKHPNLILAQPVLPWFVGYYESKEKKLTVNLDYDKLKESPSPEKTKLISVITSNKAFTQGHIERIRFVEKLKEYYGDNIDVFGRGFNDFDDKWDVLAPYKYHIVLENSSQPYYWTEKLSDAYLSETFPFYYGCTNLSDYVPNEAFINIDISDFEKSIKIIDKAIGEDVYNTRKHVLKECKHLMLDDYNMFNYIASLCDKLNPDLSKDIVTLYPCKTMQNWHNFYNYTIARNFFKVKQKIKKVFIGESPLSK